MRLPRSHPLRVGEVIGWWLDVSAPGAMRNHDHFVS